MKPVKILVLSTLAIGLGALGVSNQAYADYSGTSEYVKSVNVDFPGLAAVITVKNTSANKHVNAVKLEAQESKLDFLLDGLVECKKQNKVVFGRADAYFGIVGIGGLGDINITSTLFNEQVNVAYTEKGNDIAEATQDTFSVPLNKLKNGHPAVRVDALAEIDKKLQAYVQGGGKAVDFYKQDHDIVLQRPISLVGMCGKPANHTYGFKTKNHTVQIKYVGDPEINDKPILNAQLGNVPNQIKNDLPIKLDKAEFQPNIPHYFGQCLPENNQKIQINLQFSGNGAGYMDLRVMPVSNTYADYGTYYKFENIPVNAQATKKIDFSFPLKTMLQQDKYSYMAISNNKTWNHNMKIQGRYKSKEEGSQWSQWKDYDTAIFKHRCIPQVGVQMGGNGGKIGYDNGTADKLKVKGTLKMAPEDKPKRKTSPVKPELNKVIIPDEPKPLPILKKTVPQE